MTLTSNFPPEQRYGAMNLWKSIWILGTMFVALTAILETTDDAVAAPSADTARKCMRYSYQIYPYQRPGSVRGSGDRQTYFKGCIAKDGNVPEPPPPKAEG
jgi:hypothetical protein